MLLMVTCHEGTPRAPATNAQKPVRSRSAITRGLVSAR
jgi:hypothetical protein